MQKIKNQKKTICSIIILTVFGIGYFYFIRGYRLENIPYILMPDGDAYILVYIPLKTMMENSWPYFSNRLGTPFGTEFIDFPVMYTDAIHLFCLKVLMYIVQNEFLAVGIYYIISGFMILYISYIVLRQMKIGYLFSVLGAITYLMVPYFIERIEHFWLCLYQFIPLSILLCYWCYYDDRLFIFKKDEWKYKKNFIIFIITVFISLTGIAYYPFYTCIMLITTGLVKSRLKSIKAMRASIITVILVGGIFLANLFPLFVYQYQFGKNVDIANRQAFESEVYGLKLVQMILPTFPKTDIMKEKVGEYNKTAPLVNENATADLGLIGAVGEIILLLYLFKIRDADKNKIFLFSRLNVILFLWGTIGGLATIFSLFVTPVYRSNNRVSIFIAFLAIATICSLGNEIKENYLRRNKKLEKGFIIFSVAIFSFSIVAQMQRTDPSVYKNAKNEMKQEQKFFSAIETSMPKGAMIYQMPYSAFPEVPPLLKMPDYEALSGMLYTENLKWSFGAMKGRYNDEWQRTIAQMPIEEKIKILSIIGFKGIYIDCRGYSDKDLLKLKMSLARLLKVEPIRNTDNNKLFYSMLDFDNHYLSQYSAYEIENLKNILLNLEIEKKNDLFSSKNITESGFYKKEKNGNSNWRWMSNKATMTISSNAWVERIQFKAFATGDKEYYLKVSMNGNIIAAYNINKDGTLVSLNLPYEYGKKNIVFETNSPRIETQGDDRNMHVKIRDENISINNINFVISDLK
ncbi:hypothetical protein [Pectinatus haikarae]|uniref:Phosphoglycerol transferase n=2 Tax=Pectinatus haikarae TaxID=349096 RepID=A0ABT9Y438_9FIRM|nr:hypothetical protein [Pectinatus haikarae]MDQ0202596.1 phosphoglycerol transferase [Pectinatus haikarae]